MSDLVAPQVRAVLDAAGIPYEVLECEEHLADTETFCAHYGVPLEESANTIVVTSKRGPKKRAACVLLATTRLNVNNVVRTTLGAPKASFAGGEETAEVTGMALGGVTALGLPENLPLYVDARVMEPESIILGSGTRRSKIRIAPAIFDHIPNAAIVDGLAS